MTWYLLPSAFSKPLAGFKTTARVLMTNAIVLFYATSTVFTQSSDTFDIKKKYPYLCASYEKYFISPL
jgi:hypothetical protein